MEKIIIDSVTNKSIIDYNKLLSIVENKVTKFATNAIEAQRSTYRVS